MALTDITNPGGFGILEAARGDGGSVEDVCAAAQVAIELAAAIGGGAAGDFVFVG
ncbi:MAG TPA: hypothetical protein PLX39_15535 [Pyrinomonadaceae bacterium]|nr:hypothetical protein [Pyrinomonadaceae bacterium]